MILMKSPTFYPENAVEQNILTPADYGLPEIESVSYSHYTKNWQPAPPHVHKGRLEICYCKRGSLNFDCEGRSYTVLPNNVFISQPGDLHRLANNHKGVICYWLVFKYPSKGKSVLGLPLKEGKSLVKLLRSIDKHLFSTDTAFQSLLKELFSTVAASRGSIRTLRMRSLFLRILLSLADSASKPPTISGLNAISKIARLIRKRPYHHFTTAGMAEHVHISESRFISLFRQVIGLPPHAYLVTCRINEAKKRLLESNDPITKIAHDLGFSSVQHFSRQFDKIIRQSPSEFRLNP